MYGLPPGIDLSFFKGRVLLQICLGSNELILHFDGQVSITIEGTFCVVRASRPTKTCTVPSEGVPDLAELLGTPVAIAKGDDDGTLSLSFANGVRLDVIDSSPEFESYSFCDGKDVHVV